eukprot:3885890-Amphidinium_carterae.2
MKGSEKALIPNASALQPARIGLVSSEAMLHVDYRYCHMIGDATAYETQFRKKSNTLQTQVMQCTRAGAKSAKGSVPPRFPAGSASLDS